MSEGCRDGFCLGGYVSSGGAWGGRGRLSNRGGWMRGKGQNTHSGYIFIYVKSIKSTRKHQEIIFVALTRIQVVKNNVKKTVNLI